MTVITVTGSFQSAHGWLAVPIGVGGLYTFDMLLSGFRRSLVSQQMLNRLPMFFERTGSRSYLLRQVTLGGQGIPDLEVGVSAQIHRLQADGVLGLDFLNRFTDINLHVSTRELTFSTL